MEGVVAEGEVGVGGLELGWGGLLGLGVGVGGGGGGGGWWAGGEFVAGEVDG